MNNEAPTTKVLVAYYWPDDSSKLKYRLQVNINKNSPTVADIKKILAGWRIYGEGVGENRMILFCRDFADADGFLRWKRQQTFSLIHVKEKREGKQKDNGNDGDVCSRRNVSNHGSSGLGSLSVGSGDAGKRKKQCGKCGAFGHNARTCGKSTGGQTNQASKTCLKTRQNQCKICGELGHNARRHKNVGN